jgi:hypothetical protein
VSTKIPREQTALVVELLRYAEDHAIDLTALLLALACSGGVADEPETERVDVPAHHYPH